MGYDISDYEDIDPMYGTLADVDHLIKEMKSRGMKLMMDLVVNHTSDQVSHFLAPRFRQQSRPLQFPNMRVHLSKPFLVFFSHCIGLYFSRHFLNALCVLSAVTCIRCWFHTDNVIARLVSRISLINYVAQA